jgi:hypothetical protein
MKKNLYKLFFVLVAGFFLQANLVFAETYPEFCSVFNRTLKSGDTGTDVKRLQIVLGQEGVAYLAATGYYGNSTIAAVKVYQTRNGIYPAGKVGPQTYRFMRAQLCQSGVVSQPTDNTYIPINTINPELPPAGWTTGANWTNSSLPEISLQPVSSSGNSVTISWNTRAVSSCNLQIQGGPIQNIPAVGQQLFTLYGESSFTIKCLGLNGREYSKQILVRPNQAISNLPWVNVAISPSQAIAGQQATLYWNSQNVSYCTSNVAGYTSNLQSSGSLPVVVQAGSQSYTFTCYNSSGQSVSQTITTSNNQSLAPVINNFTYSNGLLAWGTANANSCILSGGNLGSVTVPVNGNYTVSTPTTNTTWTLMCYGGNNLSVTRQVNYSVYTSTTETGVLSISPTSPIVNQTTTFTLTGNISNYFGGKRINFGDGTAEQTTTCVGNVTSCSITHVYTNPGNYQVRVYGAGEGTQTTIATLSINVSGSSLSGDITISVSPMNQFIASGQTLTVNLSTTNASSCYLQAPSSGTYTFPPAAVAGSGQFTVTPISTTDYTVHCSNNSGYSKSFSFLVNITNSTGGQLSIDTFTINSNTTQLSWTTTNASSCLLSGGLFNNTSVLINGIQLLPPYSSGSQVGPFTLTCYGSNGLSD